MDGAVEELAQLIEFLSARFKQTEEVFASRLDASEREVALLRTLGAEGPMITKELGARFAVPVSTMTGLVDRMEEKGLVRRVRGRRDRRAIELEPTSAGTTALRDHDRSVEAIARGMLAPLSDRDRRALVTILRRVRAALENGKETS